VFTVTPQLHTHLSTMYFHLGTWPQVDPKSDGAARDWVAIYDECSRILYQVGWAAGVRPVVRLVVQIMFWWQEGGRLAWVCGARR
jgi:hypothetical protein